MTFFLRRENYQTVMSILKMNKRKRKNALTLKKQRKEKL